MKTITITEFLAKEKALDKFCTEVMIQHRILSEIGTLTPSRLDRIMKVCEYNSGIIDRILTWGITEDGHNYWNNLNRKWKHEICNDHNEYLELDYSELRAIL